MHAYMLVYGLRKCTFQCFTEALYEKKQSSMAYDAELVKLHAQEKRWESVAEGSLGKAV